jgi:hypothetical protein
MKVKKGMEDNKTYTDKQINKMFSNIPKHIHVQSVNNFLVDEDTKNKYYELKKQGAFDVNDENEEENNKVERRELDDCCPVCLEDLEEDDDLDYCKYSCGKPIHTLCFNMWVQKQADPTCLFCRALWNQEDDDNIDKNNYVNLST